MTWTAGDAGRHGVGVSVGAFDHGAAVDVGAVIHDDGTALARDARDRLWQFCRSCSRRHGAAEGLAHSQLGVDSRRNQWLLLRNCVLVAGLFGGGSTVSE